MLFPEFQFKEDLDRDVALAMLFTAIQAARASDCTWVRIDGTHTVQRKDDAGTRDPLGNGRTRNASGELPGR